MNVDRQQTKTSLFSIDDLDEGAIRRIVRLANLIKKDPKPFSGLCAGKALGLLFFEPSTRTYFSFARAMQRLGGDVIGFSGIDATSMAKGENLEDTVRVMASYTDIMVIRHATEGSIQQMAAGVAVPVINGGEGSGEHPTQTLCDLYTIDKQFKRWDICMGFYGDLKFGRTNHSLWKAAARLGARMIAIAPPALQLPQAYRDLASQHNADFLITDQLEAHVEDLDVLYVSRIQHERLPAGLDGKKLAQTMVITPAIAAQLKQSAMIMHPLPRTGEIDPAVDQDHRAYYFEQVVNSVFVRMAIILLSFPKIRSNLTSRLDSVVR